MGVTPTNIFRHLIFGGVDSADYGIYISGDAVYNAPERAVEMVSVPGRNGDVAIDLGHWENIEVEYSAGVFGNDQTEFRDSISAFRNALAGQIGYQRLTDSYHPDEYREGLFLAGVEVEPEQMSRAGQFKLVFNCKPQRFLTSGENPQTVEDGDTLTNPTAYDAQPLLAITGNGSITFNGYTVDVDPGLYGTITLSENERQDGSGYSDRFIFRVDAANANPGDALTVTMGFGWELRAISGARFTNIVNTAAPSKGAPYIGYGNNSATVALENIPYTCAVGNASTEETVTTTFAITYTQNGSTYTRTMTLTASFTYSAGNVVRFEVSATFSGGGSSQMASSPGPFAALISAVADSTKSYLGNPTYIDAETGDAYKIENDVYYSLNKYISLGAQLPALAPGANVVTFDDTITDLKITPRWWKL